MGDKRYTQFQGLLRRAIPALEGDDPRGHQRAVLSLLLHGPLHVDPAVLTRPARDTISEVRAELLAFLRGIVRGGPPAEIGTYRSITFAAHGATGPIDCEARGQHRDLVILQVVTLLHVVGLDTVRICKACPRMFVRTYRREFCSARCQKRAYMRQRRANERAKRLRATRGKKGVR